jgi:hypothetical protein
MWLLYGRKSQKSTVFKQKSLKNQAFSEIFRLTINEFGLLLCAKPVLLGPTSSDLQTLAGSQCARAAHPDIAVSGSSH